MITTKQAKKLLQPGSIVFSKLNSEIVECTVLEICDGWLETDFEILDFEDHGITWYLTKKVAEEKWLKTAT